MDSVVLLALRIGLLALLWVFILVALRAMRRDTNAAATVAAPSAAATPARRREVARQIAVVDGPLEGSHMELGTLESIILGRAPESDFVTGDDYSSARHARLFRRGSEWFIEDLESRNGTYVDGVRIDQPERVGVGNDIKLGRTTVRLMP